MPSSPSRRGRPRLRPTDSDQDPAEQILQVAADLFVANGYAATSLTAIADGVGLQRASLYHHYPNKDAILAEIGRRHLDPLLDLLRVFQSEAHRPALQLYRYLRLDLRHMLGAPYDLGHLFHMHELGDRTRFSALWMAVDEIHGGWVDWVRAAMTSGDFNPGDAALAGALVEASYLGVLSATRDVLRSDPATTADAFADHVLLGLLADRDDIADLRLASNRLDG